MRSVCLALLVMTFTTPSLAQDTSADEQARTEFELGKKAYEANSWQEAMARFEHAYELSKRPELLYNIGQSADRARQDQKALAAFEQFLALVDDSPNHPTVRARVAAMKKSEADRQAQLDLVALKRERKEAELNAAMAKEKSDSRVTKKWWFWTLLGVAVAGVAVGAFFIIDGRDRGTVGGIFGDGAIFASHPGVRF